MTDDKHDHDWIDEFISVYVAPNDATHVAEFLRAKCQPQTDALPKVGTKGKYVGFRHGLDCIVTNHVEGWLEVRFKGDNSTAVIRPSNFAALGQSK